MMAYIQVETPTLKWLITLTPGVTNGPFNTLSYWRKVIGFLLPIFYFYEILKSIPTVLQLGRTWVGFSTFVTT